MDSFGENLLHFHMHAIAVPESNKWARDDVDSNDWTEIIFSQK